MPILKSYQVPIVSRDYEREETLLDVFHSLTVLQTTIDQSFQKIQNRVELEKSRVSRINSRIGSCQTRIEEVKNKQDKDMKAITVHVTSKFPAPDRPHHSTSIHQQVILDAIHIFREPTNIEMKMAEDFDSPICQRDLLDTSLDLLTKLNLYSTVPLRVEVQMQDHALGRRPAYIDTVSSFLLFNTNVNCYRNYTIVDNLMGVDLQLIEEEKTKDLAQAPTTLMSGDILPEMAAMNFEYVYT